MTREPIDPITESATVPTASAQPNVSTEIRSWLPAYAHQARSGPFDAIQASWTWTTPDGVWKIDWTRPIFGRSSLNLRGPHGSWAFTADLVTSLRRLHDVLVALDAIAEAADA